MEVFVRKLANGFSLHFEGVFTLNLVFYLSSLLFLLSVLVLVSLSIISVYCAYSLCFVLTNSILCIFSTFCVGECLPVHFISIMCIWFEQQSTAEWCPCTTKWYQSWRFSSVFLMDKASFVLYWGRTGESALRVHVHKALTHMFGTLLGPKARAFSNVGLQLTYDTLTISPS